MPEEVQTDVACIGGGPASAFAALEILRSQKISVDIFEEHKKIGIPVNCAGLISIDGFKKLRINVPEECIQHRVKGSTFYSPSGHSIRVSRKENQALVIDRAKFDSFLMSKVESLNGKVHLNTKVNSIIKENETAIGLRVGKDRTVKCKVVIDGEGVRPKFLKVMALSPTRRENLVPAIQYDMDNVQMDDNYVEIYMGRKIAPGFFAYIIPTSNTSARVAVGSKFGTTIDYLKKFINKHPIASKKLKNGRVIKKGGGFVHLGGPIKKSYAAGFLGVGDVAGHVKATTGGGVVFGGLCAKIAGKVAIEAIQKDDFSENFLKKYEFNWHRHYLRELQLMKLLRFFLNAMPDKIIDELFLSLNKQNITELIEEMGDIDMQGALIKRVLFSPRILKIGIGILTGLFFH